MTEKTELNERQQALVERVAEAAYTAWVKERKETNSYYSWVQLWESARDEWRRIALSLLRAIGEDVVLIDPHWTSAGFATVSPLLPPKEKVR